MSASNGRNSALRYSARAIYDTVRPHTFPPSRYTAGINGGVEAIANRALSREKKAPPGTPPAATKNWVFEAGLFNGSHALWGALPKSLEA